MRNTAIVWFRNDLRLHDNEALTEAYQKGDYVLPIYVFDTRVLEGKTRFGFDKIGKFRTNFLIQAVADLKSNLQSIGSDLIIRIGHPETEVLELAKTVRSSWVYCNRERTQEELSVQDELEHSLWSVGQELRYARGKMLYHTADLPFPISQVPDTFSAFRKEVENFVSLREPLPTPTVLKWPDIEIDRGVVPTLDHFGKNKISNDHLENKMFIGGESAGIKHLDQYLFTKKLAKNYKETRDGLLGWDFSTKLSAWLSIGCLSPKYIMSQLQKFESDVAKNQSTYWIYFELLWRDYFRLMGKKYGNRIFQQAGIRKLPLGDTNLDWNIFKAWAEGNTGIPFIDANMRQLNKTGFMSNRGRQNVASFLVKDLKLDWRMGAEYFESLLIDYDPCSNYGNWNYIAGIGNDPREDRYFNVITQARKYDPHGDFVRYWIPCLSELADCYVHTPEAAHDDSIYTESQYVRPMFFFSA